MSNNNIRSGPYKDYAYRVPNTYKDFVEQARTCNQCREPTVVEYYLRTHKVETFELDPYPKLRIKHRHPADNITKASVISAIAIEKRLLHESDPGDFHLILGRELK